MRKRGSRWTLPILASTLLLAPATSWAKVGAGSRRDYLGMVKAYADALIERGRDTSGDQHTPLFAAALDRKTMALGAFKGISGIRQHDRCLKGANPMHDQNLYQVLYALAKITGKKKYAAEADKALAFFFKHCRSPATGLMAWGEHMGWDFHAENAHGDTHEFFRPWVLWDRCYELAPAGVLRFARGLWDHQIANHKTGEFSRHARWSRHGPGGDNEYPRHGGFYIATWAKAYRETQDAVYAEAVETLVEMYERLSSDKTGAIPCSSRASRARIMWPESNLSLAIDLTDAAPAFPPTLRKKMLERAAKTDRVYLSLRHNFSPKGIGFVSGADIHALKARTSGSWTHTKSWVTSYGKYTDAQVANLCRLRHRQLDEGPTKTRYRQLILASANRYLKTAPDPGRTIFPGSMGDVILHLLSAHELTGEKAYLARAHVFARMAVGMFLPDDSPLPKASTKHNHYEAITRSDTLIMALLRLWLVENKPRLDVDLIYTDR